MIHDVNKKGLVDDVSADAGEFRSETASSSRSADALPPLQVLRRYEAPEGGRRRPPWLILALCVAIVGVIATIGIVVLSSGTDKPKSTSLPPGRVFVNDVRTRAVGSVLKTATDAQLLAFGQGVCTFLASLTPGQTESRLLARPADGFAANDAVLVILAAGVDLCPTWHNAVAQWNRVPSP